MADFVAQTSIPERLPRGFEGMLADTTPSHVANGLWTATQTVTVTPSAANATVYSVNLTYGNSGVLTTFSYTSDGSGTVAEIVTGLTTAINAGSVPVTAVDGTTLMTLTSDVPGVSFVADSVGSAGVLAFATTIANGAVLPQGKFVRRDITSDPQGVRLPTASTDITTGVAVGVVLYAGNQYVLAAGGIPAPHAVNVLRKGHILVKVEEAVADGGAVYVRYAAGSLGLGSFGASAGTSERALLPAAVYRSAAAANGLAVLELNLV